MQSFTALWQDLDRERQARGWTRDRLARRISQLSQQPYAKKTLHDRMAQGRRVPWDQVVWVVCALDLDEQLWKQRWEEADKTWHRDRSSPTQPATKPGTSPRHGDATADPALTPTAPSSVSSMPVSLRFWQSRLTSIVFGFIAGVVVTLMIEWATGTNWFTEDRSRPMDCALVSSPTADVFLTPDTPESMFTKQLGDRITLPVDTPATATADGERYRLVYTRRAPSGYAYMREDALTSIPC